MSKTIEVDLTARRRNNLKVLKTIDSNIIEIIEDYSHVVAYQYDEIQTKWDRLDVEGSLFIVRSSAMPLYSLIVLNKKGPIDFILDITTLKLSLQQPYLMLKCPTDESETSVSIFGIWLHNEDELQAIYTLLVRISLKKEKPVVNTTISSYVSKADHILSLLKPIKLIVKQPIDEVKEESTCTTTSSNDNNNNNDSTNNSNSNSLKLLSMLKSPSTSSFKERSTPTTVSATIKQQHQQQPSSPTSYANALVLGTNTSAESESKYTTSNNINIVNNFGNTTISSTTSTTTLNSQKSQALKSLMMSGGSKKEHAVTPIEVSNTNSGPINNNNNNNNQILEPLQLQTNILSEMKNMNILTNNSNKVVSISQSSPVVTTTTKSKEELLLAMVRCSHPNHTSTDDLLTDHDIATKLQQSVTKTNNSNNKTITTRMTTNATTIITGINSSTSSKSVNDSDSSSSIVDNDLIEKQNRLKSILFNKITETVKETTQQKSQSLPFTNTITYNTSNTANNGGNTSSITSSNSIGYFNASKSSTALVPSSAYYTQSTLKTSSSGAILSTQVVPNSSNSNYNPIVTITPLMIQPQQVSNSIVSSGVVPSKQIVLISPSDLKSISKAI